MSSGGHDLKSCYYGQHITHATLESMLQTTYSRLHSSASSQQTIVTVFGHPMDFDVKCLLRHIGRNKGKLMHKLLGQRVEDINRCDVQDLGLAIVWVSPVQKQCAVERTSSEG